MPRTISQETLQKIDYVKQMHSEDKSLTRRHLNDLVKKRFKTGLAFGHMANVLDGGRRRKKGAGPKRGPRPAAGARSGMPGRMAGLSDRVFQNSPSFVLVIGGDKSLRVRTADSKAGVKSEIARLVESGVSPNHISLYTRDSFTVVTRPIVNMD